MPIKNTYWQTTASLISLIFTLSTISQRLIPSFQIPKKIVSKEFKVDFKGYNADEVDHFLDQVVKDYEAFAGLLNNSYDRIEQLERRLADQKAMIARLEREKALQDDNLRALEDNVSSNVDILKRLSLLEKAVFQNK